MLFIIINSYHQNYSQYRKVKNSASYSISISEYSLLYYYAFLWLLFQSHSQISFIIVSPIQRVSYGIDYLRRNFCLIVIFVVYIFYNFIFCFGKDYCSFKQTINDIIYSIRYFWNDLILCMLIKDRLLFEYHFAGFANFADKSCSSTINSHFIICIVITLFNNFIIRLLLLLIF